MKSGYKYRIEHELNKKDWEIVLIDTSGEWWDDEHWKVQFKFDQNICFYICFIVDPQFDGPRKKGQGINEIKASTVFPKSWNDDSNEFASISMTKREFEIKLKEFVDALEKYKGGRLPPKTTRKHDTRAPL